MLIFSVREQCRVLFPYTAANSDELTLAEGDIVTIVSRDVADQGWWRGELRGRVGLFPDNFVTVLPSHGNNPFFYFDVSNIRFNLVILSYFFAVMLLIFLMYIYSLILCVLLIFVSFI